MYGKCNVISQNIFNSYLTLSFVLFFAVWRRTIICVRKWYLYTPPPISSRETLWNLWRTPTSEKWVIMSTYYGLLTHWGRVTHICVRNLTIIGSDNGLPPSRRQAIIWTNAGLLLIGPLGTNFSEILIEIHIFSFKKMHLKMSSGNWRPFCLGLNVLTIPPTDEMYDYSKNHGKPHPESIA